LNALNHLARKTLRIDSIHFYPAPARRI